MAVKEAKVEEELYYLIKTVLKKHDYKINGVEFGDIEPQHSVNGGIADLVLPLSDGKHILEIECKRKVIEPKGYRSIRNFDPLGSRVINQALSYAVKIGSHIFATTNGEMFALFRTPKAGEPFRLDTHRLLVKEIRLEERHIEEILDFVAKWYARVPVRLIEVDWLFISRLRSFVYFLSNQLSPVIKKLEKDKTFSSKIDDFSEMIGGISSEQLAREVAYLLMNKIVFYKILERHYRELPGLKPLSAPDGASFMEFLKRYFEKAIEVTRDFEPIFITGIYDEIPLPDLDYVFEDVNSFIEDMDTYKLEEVGSDVVGYIYEELIPDEERHRLGQFYTPPPIAELIVKWAVRNPRNSVIDPAVGSGTFLVKAYKRLMELKLDYYRQTGKKRSKGAIHKEILSQLYADDINPFPAHLTAVNLAMRDVRYPTSEMNILHEMDFFDLKPRYKFLAPYSIRTPAGDFRRKIVIPGVDVVVANPPYTRWVEIPEKTQQSINKSIGGTLKKYKLMGGIGNETGIYVHFIMHAHDFLKKNGKLGMIISNSWLQADYGINFSNFLLDHFKVKAVIDFNQRLFRIPLIATCVLLLEKERSAKTRNENKTIFLYVDTEAKVDEILDALVNPEGWKDKFLVNVVRQGDLPRDQKWIKKLFNTDEIEQAISKAPLTTLTSNLFEPRYGNILGVSARGGTGADKFFYLTKNDVRKWGLMDRYLSPLLVRTRYTKFFTFTQNDWEQLKDAGKPCYAFVCHKHRELLPKNVKNFVEWGEKTPLVRVRRGEEPKTACESMASRMREKDRKHFCGWYDLGNVVSAPIFTSRRAQYHHRFVMSETPNYALDDGFITLIPKQQLSESELITELAYLNSDFSRFFVEIYGRSTGGGVIELDDKSAGKLPILDYRKVTKKQAATLNELFEKLEIETRQIGGADTQENLEKLQHIVDEIDVRIANILGLERELVERIRKIVGILSERRISRTERARPEAVKGEEEPTIKPPKKRRRQKKEEFHRPLTNWMK